MREVVVFKWNLQVASLQPKYVSNSCDHVLMLPINSNTACLSWHLLPSESAGSCYIFSQASFI